MDLLVVGSYGGFTYNHPIDTQQCNQFSSMTQDSQSNSCKGVKFIEKSDLHFATNLPRTCECIRILRRFCHTEFPCPSQDHLQFDREKIEINDQNS